MKYSLIKMLFLSALPRTALIPLFLPLCSVFFFFFECSHERLLNCPVSICESLISFR